MSLHIVLWYVKCVSATVAVCRTICDFHWINIYCPCTYLSGDSWNSVKQFCMEICLRYMKKKSLVVLCCISPTKCWLSISIKSSISKCLIADKFPNYRIVKDRMNKCTGTHLNRMIEPTRGVCISCYAVSPKILFRFLEKM